MIFRIPAEVLLGKRLGSDKTYERGLASVEESLRVAGNLSCYDLIKPGEFEVFKIKENLDYFIDELENEST